MSQLPATTPSLLHNVRTESDTSTSMDSGNDTVGDLKEKFPNGSADIYGNESQDTTRSTSLDETSKFRRRSSSASYRPPLSLQQPDADQTLPGDVSSSDATPKGRFRQFYDKNRGLAYVLLAQIFGCLMNVTTRLLEVEGNKGKGMHPFQILFVRMIITTTLSVIYMWWTSTPYFPFGMKEVRWLLVLRGIGGFFGVFGMYYSLLFLPLADATVITFISPSISCFACSILIKEPFTRMEQVGALVSFLGVTLIARPTTFFHHGKAEAPPADGTDDAPVSHGGHGQYNRVTNAERMGAVMVALVGVLGQAMAFTTMRWMGKRAHPLLSVTYFCAMCTIVSAAAMSVLPNVPFTLPQDAKEWGYLVFLGICGFVMQFLLSAGLQIEKSSRATNMVYTQMLFALIFDKLVFGTDPSVLSLLGSSLILGSAIYVALQKESLKQRMELEKQRQNEATASGRALEMGTRNIGSSSRPEEERGLVAGVDADDDAGEVHHTKQNGFAKPS